MGVTLRPGHVLQPRAMPGRQWGWGAKGEDGSKRVGVGVGLSGGHHQQALFPAAEGIKALVLTRDKQEQHSVHSTLERQRMYLCFLTSGSACVTCLAQWNETEVSVQFQETLHISNLLLIHVQADLLGTEDERHLEHSYRTRPATRPSPV